MKAMISTATLAMLAVAMPASARNDLVDPCIHCDIKDKVIHDLKSQIRQFQETGSATSATPPTDVTAVETPAIRETSGLLGAAIGGGIPVTTGEVAAAASPVSDAPLADATEPVASTGESATATEQAAATAEAPSEASATYTVQAGDGLMKIGRLTGHSAQDIAAANGLTLESVIYPGMKLKLPGGTSSTPPATATDPAPAATSEAAQPKTYRIKAGDTYYSLSRRLKIPLDELMAANPQAKATALYEGRIINLPAETADGPAPAPTASATGEDTTGEPAETGTTEPPAASTEGAEPPAEPEMKIRSIKVTEEISYGEFATRHNTSIERLNSLNDLNLTSTTILAIGSELYVPAQP